VNVAPAGRFIGQRRQVAAVQSTAPSPEQLQQRLAQLGLHIDGPGLAATHHYVEELIEHGIDVHDGDLTAIARLEGATPRAGAFRHSPHR
jgi:hypothetical protein